MSADPLRRRAEKLFGKASDRSKGRLAAMPPEALRGMLHELGVHQIELEMQNEELRRKQADLDEARAKYLDLYDSAPVGYCSINGKELVLEANRAISALLGVSRDELLGRPLSRAIVKEDVDKFYLLRKQVIKTGEKQECELRLRRQGGMEFWASLTCSIARDEAGSPLQLRVIISDITARKLIEDKARNLNLELEARVAERTSALQGTVLELKGEVSERRRLEREILKISDHEQSRIGRDLHDGACQELAGLAVLAEVVARDLDRENSQAAAKVLEISKLARQSLDEIRRLAAGLLSVKVEQHGLEWALRDLADETSARNNVRCVFTVREPIPVADSNASIQIYRIVQEAVSNALRHGRAQNITIELAGSYGTTSLAITDDGVGLPRRRKKDGLGLHSMQYRAKRLGGSLEVRPAPKSGTVVACSFPDKEFHHGKEKRKN